MADARRLSVLGYRSQVDACVALADAGLTPAEIGVRIGRDAGHVRAALRGRKAVPKPRTFTLPRHIIECLGSAAAARGIEPVELARQLLDTIVEDDLFDALLGEAVAPQQTGGAADG